ncbi:MAG: PH domain-containing protein [Promethearchaeota archaeon]
MEQSHTEEKNLHLIESSYLTREMIGSVLVSFLIGLGIYGIGWFIVFVSADDGKPVNQSVLWPIIFGVILGIVILINALNYIITTLYLRNFSYEFSEKFIIIRYGAFTKTKTTIPYSRIQNIAVFQNIRDRLLNIYTVKIETAGSSAATSSAQKGMVRPEGYIPAVKDPSHLENMINKLVHQYTQDVSSNVKDKVFTDSNIVFDEFIAYFLSKMREKDQLRTKIKGLRENANLSQAQLAEQLGVADTTVKYLEAGEYVPSLTLALQIAKVFNVSIEQIFELTK